MRRLRVAILIAAAAVWLLPLLFVGLTAVRAQRDLIAGGVFNWGGALHWNNFTEAWRIGHFGHLFGNSLLLILIKVPCGLLLSSMAAYALARIPFRLNWLVFLLFLAGLAIPVHVTLLPMAILLKRLHWNNTLFSLIPPYVALGLPFQTLVLSGFFRTIPDELLEAASLDGCSEFAKYWRIVVPLAKPAILTLAIIDVVGTWNELLIALVLIGAEKWQTVPLGLLQFQGQFASRYTVVMAAILIAIAPVLLVYIVFQRYLSTEMSAGALKE
ncbi:MAG TPA: carbohydrate ABC transporter permease [Bryobacteraceae bacterium]|jgi:raffinose/stachyose/melibiose transport system permease protein